MCVKPVFWYVAACVIVEKNEHFKRGYQSMYINAKEPSQNSIVLLFIVVLITKYFITFYMLVSWSISF